MSFGFILPPEHVTRHHFRDPVFKKVFIISLTVHLVLLAIAGTTTLFRMSGTTYSPSYTVDLVTLPPSPAPKPSAITAPKPAVTKPKTPVPKAAKVESKPPAATVKRKAPEEPAFTTEPMRPRVGDEAARRERRKRLEDLEKQAVSQYESYLTDEERNDRTLQSAVGPVTDLSDKLEDEAGSDRVTGVTGTSTGGPSADIRYRAYYDRIWSLIRAAWVVPEGLGAGGKDLVTVAGIRISPTGVIEDQWIEKSSGNIYYDESVRRAIRKANPLPLLPQGLDETSLEVGINFRINE